MKRRSRKNPLATARDLNAAKIIDLGGGQGRVDIAGVPGDPFTFPGNVWSGIAGKPDLSTPVAAIKSVISPEWSQS